jgi:energy-coupling factor transporter ATP-binding protein EcfA2
VIAVPTSQTFFERNMAEVRGLNQRGGRMLSIIDLISRGTVDINLAARLLARIHDGASFLCCALQGGVGKTTLMGALLGLLPPREEIVTVASESEIGTMQQLARDGKQRCLVVHEIGSGSWYGYLWGKPVLEYIALKSATTRIVSNIHADELEEVEAQVRSFGGTSMDVLAFDLILFVALGKGSIGGERRRIMDKVLEAAGDLDSRTVHEFPVKVDDVSGAGALLRSQHEARESYERGYRVAKDFLQCLVDEGITMIEDVAARVAGFHDRLDLATVKRQGEEGKCVGKDDKY